MIASIKGKIDIVSSSYAVVDVNGVGYKILLPGSILSALSIGKEIKFFTYTHVREDILELYGFLGLEDLKLFEYLIGVSGVGPKTALLIFSTGNAQEIINAVISADLDFFTSVPRLGKKNAQKIIIELKGKLGSTKDLNLSENFSKENEDAITALQNFGFTQKEAADAIKALKGEGDTTEEKIRMALRSLGK